MPQKKNKRKKRTHHLQQQQKNSLNQYKKQLQGRLKNVLDLLECGHLYDKISRKEMEAFYLMHFSSARVEAAEDQNIYSKQVKFYNWFFNHWLKEHTIELYPGGPKLSIHNFFAFVYTFHFYATLFKGHHFPALKIIKETMEEKLDLKALENKASELMVLMRIIGAAYRGDLVSFFYLFDIGIRDCQNYDTSSIRLVMYKQIPEKLSVKLNGEERTVYRVGVPGNKKAFQYYRFKAKTLKLSENIFNKSFDVYIQAHALERLYERLDCIVKAALRISALASLSRPRVHTGKGRTRLLEFRFNDKQKLGYFVTEVLKDKVVIRTFLFLTQEGTPEGDRLKELMDASREDAKYWALDRISTFLESDIQNNERLKSKFIEAGCGSLFRLNLEPEGPAPETMRQADAMVKYFGLDEEQGTMA